MIQRRTVLGSLLYTPLILRHPSFGRIVPVTRIPDEEYGVIPKLERAVWYLNDDQTTYTQFRLIGWEPYDIYCYSPSQSCRKNVTLVQTGFP